MSNKAFQQNLDDKKGPQPGGPYLIQMLFKEPVEMPDKEKMTAIMEKHIGSTECFCYDKKMAGFAALDHVAEFQDGKCPVQLMVMKCDKFKGKGFDAFLMSQMWDCQEDRDRIFRECKYQVVATDMLAAAIPAVCANVIFLLKETSVFSAISLMDLMFTAKDLIGQYYNTTECLVMLVGFYIIMLLPVSVLGTLVEHKARYRMFGD